VNSSLLLTAFLMGLFGGPHCLAMCGAACVGIGKAKDKNGTSLKKGQLAVLEFQVGRIFGYASLGAVGAFSVQSVGWLSIHSALFRPVWGLFHVCALVVGLVLIWRAEQPMWLDALAKDIWRKVATENRLSTLPLSRFGPLALGFLWALLPCGLLYSALWVAALSANPLEGALVMSAFAFGSAIVLSTGPLIWRAFKSADRIVFTGRSPNAQIAQGKSTSMQGAWGVRLAGCALVIVSAIALWHGIVQNQAPWCVVNQPY